MLVFYIAIAKAPKLKQINSRSTNFDLLTLFLRYCYSIVPTCF